LFEEDLIPLNIEILTNARPHPIQKRDPVNDLTHIMQFLAVAVCLAALSGCSDDDTIVEPQPFQVVIEVTDAAGAPVAGLDLGLAPDSPHYQDGKRDQPDQIPQIDHLRQPFPCPFFPSAIVAFDLEAARTVHLTIEDVEGGLVKLLGEGPQPMGSHQWQWTGQDDDDDRVPSGVYQAHLILRDEGTGEVVLDESQPMLLAAFYPDQVKVGTTDAAGRIVLDDRRLFPYLYDVPDFPAVNEIGEPMGTISMTATTRFYLADPLAGDIMRFDGEVAGPVTLRFTWDPAP